MTSPIVNARVLAVCRVFQLLPDAGNVGVTAIDKRSVKGPVAVRRLGLYADVQADRKFHGGPEQAVYAYAQEVVDEWAVELGRDLPPGIFGENLRTEGIDVDGAPLGQVWRVGTALLQVSAPRVPCATFARRMGEPRWVKRFTERGKVGAYLRVLKNGEVQAGSPIEVVSTPSQQVPVERWFSEGRTDDARALRAIADAGEFEIGPALEEYVERSLSRG